MIDEQQMRAARGLLNWTQHELADRAGVSQPTIKRIEKIGPGRSSVDTVTAIQKAFETAGVEFIPENGGGAGVRLAKRKDAGE